MLLAMFILLADKDSLYASKIQFIILEQTSHHESGYYEPVPLKRIYEKSQ
jgi:hypothetical protein